MTKRVASAQYELIKAVDKYDAAAKARKHLGIYSIRVQEAAETLVAALKMDKPIDEGKGDHRLLLLKAMTALVCVWVPYDTNPSEGHLIVKLDGNPSFRTGLDPEGFVIVTEPICAALIKATEAK